MSPAALALAGILCLTACEEWHLSINSDGLVFISVTGDNGEPRRRFRVRTRDAAGAVRTLDVPETGPMRLTPAVGGPLELTLLTPEDCHVEGANPLTLTVAERHEIRVAFSVRCA